MRELLHHVEAGIVFMFAMTCVSWLVIVAYMGWWLWSIWALTLVVVYALGRISGRVAERRVADEIRERVRRDTY